MVRILRQTPRKRPRHTRSREQTGNLEELERFSCRTFDLSLPTTGQADPVQRSLMPLASSGPVARRLGFDPMDNFAALRLGAARVATAPSAFYVCEQRPVLQGTLTTGGPGQSPQTGTPIPIVARTIAKRAGTERILGTIMGPILAPNCFDLLRSAPGKRDRKRSPKMLKIETPSFSSTGFWMEARMATDPGDPGVSPGLTGYPQNTDTKVVIGFCSKLRIPVFSP